MAADFNLTNQYISQSFEQLMQISGSIPVNGTGSAISNLTVTASRATNADSASYATTASYALNGGVTSIIAGTNVTIDQSQGDVTINSSGGGGSAFPYTGSAKITGSLQVIGPSTLQGVTTVENGKLQVNDTFQVTFNNTASQFFTVGSPGDAFMNMSAGGYTGGSGNWVKTANMSFAQAEQAFFSAENDFFIKNIYAGTGSITLWAENSLNVQGNNIKVSGSRADIGDGTRTGLISSTFPSPNNFSQKNFFNVTGATSPSGRSYNNVSFNIQDYTPGGNYVDAFIMEKWDSFGYNFGSEILTNGERSSLTVSPSGSGGSSANVSIFDQNNGLTKGTFKADEIAIETVNRPLTLSSQGSSGGNYISTAGVFQHSPNTITISANTASYNVQNSPFVDLELVSGSNTHLVIGTPFKSPGTETRIRITQPTSSADSVGTLSFESYFKFPGGVAPTITQTTGSVDVITFRTFDGVDFYGEVSQDYR